MDTITLYFDVDRTVGIDPIRPRPLRTPYSEPNTVDGKRFIAHDWRKKRVLMEEGYIIQPNDCPPIRNLNSYGFEFFASAKSRVRRNSVRRKKHTTEDSATNGWYTHSGDRCRLSDSGFFTSWIGNSDYFKVITGVVVYCPVGYGLYQGGNPFEKDSPFDAVAAIEYSNSRGIFEISSRRYFIVELNLVCSFEAGELVLDRGQPLGVFYPVLNPRQFSLGDLQDNQ